MQSNFFSVTTLIHLNTLTLTLRNLTLFFFLTLTLLIEALAVETKEFN